MRSPGTEIVPWVPARHQKIARRKSKILHSEIPKPPHVLALQVLLAYTVVILGTSPFSGVNWKMNGSLKKSLNLGMIAMPRVPGFRRVHKPTASRSERDRGDRCSADLAV